MGVKTFTHNSPAHSQEMLGKLNMLRNDGHFCDITIRVQDKIFRAHKVVLAACSDFFRSKLVGQAEEESKSVLDLHHVTVTGFIPLLEYAYTATLSINTENIIDVLAAASYMQMFSVASTCSEFMKSSILWNTPNSQQEKVLDAGQENSANCNFTSRDGSLSPVSSECSVVERTIPVCRESRRKRKSYIVMSPESPLKCNTQTSSPQVLNPSTSYPESRNQPVDSSLAFPWTFPFGIDRRLQSEKVKQAENSRTLEMPGPSESTRRMGDYVTCESTKASSPLVIEEDVRVKVERLSDEEVHEEVSQPVSASQSSLSDQQTVPGSEQVQEDLLISPQSSSIGMTLPAEEICPVGFHAFLLWNSLSSPWFVKCYRWTWSSLKNFAEGSWEWWACGSPLCSAEVDNSFLPLVAWLGKLNSALISVKRHDLSWAAAPDLKGLCL